MSFTPLRDLQNNNDYKQGDLLVIFGELFDRGYANGLVKAAKSKGMKVITGTVGRRDKDGSLRPLNQEEISEKTEEVINIPLEAGFDFEKGPAGLSAVDMLSGLKMSQWKEAKIDWAEIEKAQQTAVAKFKKQVSLFLEELEQKYVKPGTNILFAHLMAGGFPRSKIIMTVANRVFKGSGERYGSSESFWSSEIGKLCNLNFNEVTGETFEHLINLSSNLREKITSNSGNVAYTGYGYHGTEVYVNDQLEWQSYAPYLQGWAKIRLENIAKNAFSNGVNACVFNAPEILTNSSSIFLGVEVPLYKLMYAIKKIKGDKAFDRIAQKCASLLKDEHSVEEVLKRLDDYFSHTSIKRLKDFSTAWPQHNDAEQMLYMRSLSSEIIDMHKDKKQLMTAELSEIIADGCGEVILDESWKPRHPVAWIGHDLIAQLTD